jgi:hypothetical protein
MDAMCFVFNRDTISQAGRLGFLPRLPFLESIACEYRSFGDTPLLPFGSQEFTSSTTPLVAFEERKSNHARSVFAMNGVTIVSVPADLMCHAMFLLLCELLGSKFKKLAY